MSEHELRAIAWKSVAVLMYVAAAASVIVGRLG